MNTPKIRARAAGYSEDSDYTSDLNFPVGQNANSSASQYRNLRTPQLSLETSRENSYEKDDRSYYDSYAGDSNKQMLVRKWRAVSVRSLKCNNVIRFVLKAYSPMDEYQYKDGESDPLFYNSRPLK